MLVESWSWALAVFVPVVLAELLELGRNQVGLDLRQLEGRSVDQVLDHAEEELSELSVSLT